jgi:hypothetical protein
VNESKPLLSGKLREAKADRKESERDVRAAEAGAYTRPHFGSTQAHFVGYVGCMIFPKSIRQGDTGRFDQNGSG